MLRKGEVNAQDLANTVNALGKMDHRSPVTFEEDANYVSNRSVHVQSLGKWIAQTSVLADWHAWPIMLVDTCSGFDITPNNCTRIRGYPQISQLASGGGYRITQHQTMSEETENTVRTLIGTLGLVGSLVLFWYCCYRYAVCRDKEEKARITYVNPPKQQSLNDLI